MVRKIIEIDREKCNGCGLCASACHEGAIGMVDGKAQLLRDDYCDGLGNCLPVCPTGAIRFIEREAAAYDEKAVQENMKKAQSAPHSGWPAWMGVVLAIIVCTVLGMAIERLAYKPLRAAPSLAVLITAIGVSYFLQNAALLIWTSNPKSFSSVVTGGAISLFGGQLQISRVTLVTVFACVVIMVALMLFTGKSKVGTAMRAVSEDKGAAQLMGINVNTTISITFAIGSGLAAIAGVLLCSAYPTLMPTTGSLPGIKAFTAAVFGGIGSIPGAFVGGVLLGIIEIFAKAYISTQLSDAIVFGVLIVVLLVKPDGLLGKHVSEKV